MTGGRRAGKCKDVTVPDVGRPSRIVHNERSVGGHPASPATRGWRRRVKAPTAVQRTSRMTMGVEIEHVYSHERDVVHTDTELGTVDR